ncbi:Methyltransferase domain-containing protein [Arenibacter palladensis]|uniref:Methyltransferase domain-containing protein n=1 Tax=Arenibacter palladensis TaxID=237373 RepID=A0A1M5BME0_9FLAO|nr:class I SAM-dependent methyltransferase [Arenibacter palladensis]SHF43783.1 Methyltransferase domain-containing protein [Arenibacter palladensis]
MDRYKETSETWNKIASLYQDKFMDLDLYNKTYDLICSSISAKNARILEIGCGPGNITRYLLSKRPDFRILGIDVAPNMIKLAEKNNPTATFKVLDCRQLGGLNTLYDGIVCGFCLPFLSPTDCIKLIADCKRLLINNGLLYLSFVEGDPNKSNFKVDSNGDRVYFHFHELEILKTLLASKSFGEPEVYHIDYERKKALLEIHTVLISRKNPHEKE